MKKMEAETSQQKSGGTKSAPANSKKSFALKDKCKLLTIGDYIELVCENNLSVLIAEGEPDKEALNEAKMDVISEFSELSGDEVGSAVMSALRKIYMYRAQIKGMAIALQLLPTRTEDAIEILKGFGVRASISADPDDMEKYIKRVEAEIKAKNVRLQMEVQTYNSLSTKSEVKRTTSQDFFDEMSSISIALKLSDLSPATNLALYAAHRKNYKRHIKILNHGSNKK